MTTTIQVIRTVHDTTTVIQARVWFDDHGCDYAGWYAEYVDEEGYVIDDSEKASHPELPTDPDARDEAMEMATVYAGNLAAARCLS